MNPNIKPLSLIILLFLLLQGAQPAANAQNRKKKPVARHAPPGVHPDYIRQSLVTTFTLRNFTYEIWTGIKNSIGSKKMTPSLEEAVDSGWYLVYLIGKGKHRHLTRYFGKQAVDAGGKITGTCDYRIDGDSLLVGCNTYGGHFESRLVLVYTPDKYGWLTESSDRWEPLRADTLSDAYRKPYPVYAPAIPSQSGK